jgi:ankyrin repeat protein
MDVKGQDLFQRLLDTKADPNIPDSSGRYALDIAVDDFGKSVIEMLLKAGAKPVSSSLAIAAGRSRHEIMRLLLDHKVDILLYIFAIPIIFN